MSGINEAMASAPEWFFWYSGSEDWREASLPQPEQAHCRVCGESTDQVLITNWECEVCTLSLVD